MIVAMMSPLILQPLRHLQERSFTDRRARATILFVIGYGAVWMTAGAALQTLAIVTRLELRTPGLPLLVGALTALVWQVSPAKQRCLNGCHRRRPLAAFGMAADRDAVVFGLSHGLWCVGACWALMLLPLLCTNAHLLVMIGSAGFLFAERRERPRPLAWRWRGPGGAVRLAVSRLVVKSYVSPFGAESG
jgi:predicted metal-binding membrane protein